jgi:hypothetical protein
LVGIICGQNKPHLAAESNRSVANYLPRAARPPGGTRAFPDGAASQNVNFLANEFDTAYENR